ncbi:MAG: hypothetical protein V3U65_06315 [Granulosicoccaceae bacterium]
MSSYTLSWSRAVGDGSSSETSGGTKAEATLEGMLSNLKKTLNKSGSVSLAVIDGPEIGPQLLQVETQGGKSLLTLGVDDGDDYIVRHYVQTEKELNAIAAEPEKIKLFGNYWDKHLICTDKEIVTAVFTEFFETGDIPRTILN